MFCSNWIVDTADVGCQLPVCHILQSSRQHWNDESRITAHQWRRRITFWGRLLTGRAAEWGRVAEPDDNENSCDKDVMDVGSGKKKPKQSWIISRGRCAAWSDLVRLCTRQSALQKHVPADLCCARRSYHRQTGQRQRCVLSNSCHSQVFEHVLKHFKCKLSLIRMAAD